MKITALSTGASADLHSNTICFEFDPINFQSIIRQGIKIKSLVSIGVPDVNQLDSDFVRFLDEIWEIAGYKGISNWSDPSEVLRAITVYVNYLELALSNT